MVKFPERTARPACICTSFIILFLFLLLLLLAWRGSFLCGAREQLAHIFITGLREIFVILADGLKEYRRAQTDRLISLLFELAASVWRPDRHCHDNFCGTALSQGLH